MFFKCFFFFVKSLDLPFVLDLCSGSGASSQYRLFAPLLVFHDHHTEHSLESKHMIHPDGLHLNILSNPYARPKLSDAFSAQNWKCSSKTFCVTIEPLQGCETKTFLRRSNKSQKHTLCFLISTGKTSSHKIVSHQGFPQCRVLFSVFYVMFSLQATQHRYVEGQWTLCCVRTAVTLTNFQLLLLHVWSLLNVHADGMWRAERKHLKTQQKMS